MQHLRGGHVNVASKQVISSTTGQNAVCFVSVADRGLRPKASFRKQKRQQGCWRFPVRAQYYPGNTIRGNSLFVNRKLLVPAEIFEQTVRVAGTGLPFLRQCWI